MAIKAKPPTERDYWEGVKDGMAEMAEQVGTLIRDSIAEAEADHAGTPVFDLVSRSSMIAALQGLARRLEEVSARVAQIVDEGNNPPREES